MSDIRYYRKHRKVKFSEIADILTSQNKVENILHEHLPMKKFKERYLEMLKWDKIDFLGRLIIDAT